MPFPIDVDATWLNPAAVQLDAGELRRADAALLAGAGGFAFGGIARHSDTSLAVTVDGSDNVTVQPGSVVIPGDAATGVGVYRASLAAAATNPLPTARNATNPRMDLVVFQVLDTDVVGSHGAYKGRINVIAGTPSATPAVPVKPSMAVELARITVPATSGGAASVDSTYRTYACAAGGELVVPTVTRLPSSGVPKRQLAIALDTGFRHRHDGASWVAIDTDWAGVTLSGGWTGTLFYARRAGMVTVTMGVNRAAFNPGDGVYTLPVGFRPGVQVQGVGSYDGGLRTFTVEPSGVIAGGGPAQQTGGIYGSVTFPVVL